MRAVPPRFVRCRLNLSYHLRGEAVNVRRREDTPGANFCVEQGIHRRFVFMKMQEGRPGRCVEQSCAAGDGIRGIQNRKRTGTGRPSGRRGPAFGGNAGREVAACCGGTRRSEKPDDRAWRTHKLFSLDAAFKIFDLRETRSPAGAGSLQRGVSIPLGRLRDSDHASVKSGTLPDYGNGSRASAGRKYRMSTVKRLCSLGPVLGLRLLERVREAWNFAQRETGALWLPRSFQLARGMRSIRKRSDVRAYQPVPCMRAMSFKLGVSM
jgi:hypothetical protein